MFRRSPPAPAMRRRGGWETSSLYLCAIGRRESAFPEFVGQSVELLVGGVCRRLAAPCRPDRYPLWSQCFNFGARLQLQCSHGELAIPHVKVGVELLDVHLVGVHRRCGVRFIPAKAAGLEL